MARILIVDDHSAIREAVRSLLSANSQWEVCGEAENGKVALQKAQELKPDLVIIDVNMPVMDGIEAIRQLRRIAPGVKVVLLTVHDSEQIKSAARKAGADAFIRKDAAGRLLLNEVKRLLNGLV